MLMLSTGHRDVNRSWFSLFFFFFFCAFIVMCSNLVSSDGVRHLAEVLRHNTTLRFLDLSSNRIGDEGAEFLSAALARQGCYLTG